MKNKPEMRGKTMKFPLAVQMMAVIAVFEVFFSVALSATLQFTMEGVLASDDTVTWTSVNSFGIMSSVHAATNGWSLAVKDGGKVFFDNGVSSPFGFPDSATNSVSYVFTVVECAERVDHATLIDAPCSIRFIPNPFNTPDAFFYECQLTNSVALSLNATATNSFTPAARLQLIEAIFDPPAPLNEIYMGGAPATAAWAQSWSGGIAELILLAEVPTEEQINALRRYLALKYGLAVLSESDGGIVTTLTAMGVDIAGLFNTIFMVR